MWNSIVSVPDHCLFIYFVFRSAVSDLRQVLYVVHLLQRVSSEIVVTFRNSSIVLNFGSLFDSADGSV